MTELRIPEAEPARAIDVELRRSRLPVRRARRGLVASSHAKEAALYGAAGVTYIGAGVFVTELALSWVVGFAWLLLWVWGLPALARRLRR